MKKIITPLFILFTLCIYSNNEKKIILNKISVKGKVIDSRTKEGIPFTTVVLKSNSSDNTTGGISNNDGFFEIKNVPEGKYTVELQFIGYNTHSLSIEVTAQSSDMDLGIIELEELSKNTIPSIGEFHWESQTAYIGFSYRFGSSKNKNRSRKNRKGNDKQGGGFL